MHKIYRVDIDGVRGVAVISVILFHLGFLPNGYLGVDVFFVISGYLITGIVYNEVKENTFSILKFYERRIRRIIPLVLFTTLVAFILGICFMLPDDLENLAQSIFASNFSANNILMYITSSDYWAVKNDYKPLMHTWSLGIEEQFYLLYPILFFVFKNNKRKFILPVLIFLTLISLILFFITNDYSSKFYLLQYRFFELSFGGICAIYFENGKAKMNRFLTGSKFLLYILLFAVVFILLSKNTDNNDVKVIMITIFSAGILVLGEQHFQRDNFYKNILCNKFLLGVGKISFSLYMWHQIIFAFARYTFIEEISVLWAVVLTSLVIVLSILTYYLIEQTFRDRKKIGTKKLLFFVGIFFAFTSISAFYVYAIGGVIKDVPELNLKKSDDINKFNFFDSNNNIHIQYNEDIRNLDKPFVTNNKIKVLVIGNSFARDFTNILLESSFKNKVEISYYDYNRKKPNREMINRFQEADFIFIANDFLFTKYLFQELKLDYKIDSNKIWIVGIKDFGNSNGIFYNKRNKIEDCKKYRTYMKKNILEYNDTMKKEWGNRYIDLIKPVSDTQNRVLVFTPDCKFISQDTYHLTKFGVSFYSVLLEKRLTTILQLR
ncbi:acyltransferase family protein [Flavobacterium daemonense]|uniref:acyltransferase family protein n=1 Tax=Flavobacterium daemonense TaxID=1393049 RepID=UPI0011860346|nr:acyltransferase [Flavobacterium daemonense]KAF2333139.1 acyltransferase [Flavobacterium daemonense]